MGKVDFRKSLYKCNCRRNKHFIVLVIPVILCCQPIILILLSRCLLKCLTTIFPFHFIFDRELCIVQTGDVLQRICFGTLVVIHLDQYFQISRPKIDLNFDSIKKRMKSVFMLEAKHNGMCLKGQMSYFESDDLIFSRVALGY